jgi:O-antigen ligase
MMWLVWETASSGARLVSLMQAYVLGAYVTAGSTILNYVTGTGYRHTARFAASGFDPNDVGSLLALGLPMAWYLASVFPSAFQRWLNRGYFLFGPVAILLTSSRGALLATLVALFVVPWTLTRLRRGVRVAAVVIMLGAGVAAVRFVPEKSFERLSTTASEITEGTLNNRLEIWKAGIAAVPERPIHGFGPGGFQPAVAPRLGRGEAPHNTFLSVLVEEGMIGLALYLTLLLVVLNRVRRLPTFERRVALTLLGTLLTVMMPLGWDTHKESWLVLALLAAWSEVMAPSRLAAASARTIPGVLRRPPRAVTPVSVE